MSGAIDVLAALLMLLAPAASAVAQPAQLLLVGDSTMAPRTGYGDALCARLPPPVTCLNLARGGRSTGSFRDEGLWQPVLDRLRDAPAGTTSHVLIQFGHNDQPGKPGRSTDRATEFPDNLARYVRETRAAGGVPVLVTPLTRRRFRDGTLDNDLQPWAETVRGVAQALDAPLLDLNASSAAAVQAMGPEEADRLAEAAPGQPRFDRTHLGARGACVFAQQVAQALRQQVPAVPAAVDGPDCRLIAPPGA